MIRRDRIRRAVRYFGLGIAGVSIALTIGATLFIGSSKAFSAMHGFLGFGK